MQERDEQMIAERNETERLWREHLRLMKKAPAKPTSTESTKITQAIKVHNQVQNMKMAKTLREEELKKKELIIEAFLAVKNPQLY